MGLDTAGTLLGRDANENARCPTARLLFNHFPACVDNQIDAGTERV